MSPKRLLAAPVALATGLIAWTEMAVAETVIGQPVDWGLGFQPAASPVMARITEFHNMLLVIITLITLFVTGLMVYVFVKFNAKANPTPSKTTHNTTLEVLWTVVPIVILVIITIPSFKLLYYVDVVPEADLTIKATGLQWYWTYEYPDEGFGFDAFMVDEESLEPGQPRLLATDYNIVVPVGKVVRVQVSADDVIHSWAVPSLGVKIDAVPGRLNETWFSVDEPGIYYGQCSELCGVNHAFMPIAVEAVTQEDYDAWLVEARAEFVGLDQSLDQSLDGPTKLVELTGSEPPGTETPGTEFKD